MVELTYRQHRALLAALKILVIVSLAFLFSWLVANYVGWEVPSNPELYRAAALIVVPATSRCRTAARYSASSR